MLKHTRPAIAWSLLLFTAACSTAEQTTESPALQVDSVSITAPASDVRVGETVQLLATAWSAGRAIERSDFIWFAPADGIASVSTTGLVTATGAGTVTISAEAEGKVGLIELPVIPVDGYAPSVAIGSDVSASARAHIRSLISVVDSVSVTGTGPARVVTTNDGGAAPIIATNADGEPLLAALATSSAPTQITARTTALSLILPLFRLPAFAQTSASDIESRVTARAAFDTLVQAIRVTSETGVSYATSPDVSALVARIAEGVARDLLAPASSTADRVSATLAANVGLPGIPVVAAGDKENSADYDMLNSAYIAFATSSIRPNGSSIGSVVLGRREFSIWDAVTGADQPTVTVLRGEANGRTRIRVYQDRNTKLLHGLIIASHLIEAVFSYLGSEIDHDVDQFAYSTATIMFSEEAIVGFMENSPAEASKDLALQFVGNLDVFLPRLATFLVSKVGTKRASAYIAGVMAAHAIPGLNGLRVVAGLAFTATGVAEKFPFYRDLGQYYAADATVDVCQTNGTFAECVARVEISPSASTTALGGRVTLTARVIGAQGTDLTAATTLAWTSSNPAIATVDASGRVTGVALGTVTISATTDGITGTASVEVANFSLSGSWTMTSYRGVSMGGECGVGCSWAEACASCKMRIDSGRAEITSGSFAMRIYASQLDHELKYGPSQAIGVFQSGYVFHQLTSTTTKWPPVPHCVSEGLYNDSNGQLQGYCSVLPAGPTFQLLNFSNGSSVVLGAAVLKGDGAMATSIGGHTVWRRGSAP